MIASMHNLIESIRTEKNGFHFGEPWKKSETAKFVLIPILRERIPETEYMLFEGLVPRMQELNWKNCGWKVQENQIGVVCLDARGVDTIEFVDIPATWKIFHDRICASIIKAHSNIKFGEGIVKTSFPDKERLISLAKTAMHECMLGEVVSVENELTTNFNSMNFLGEYTCINNRVVHYFAIRKEEQRNVKNTDTI
jgi:hypothetical protein